MKAGEIVALARETIGTPYQHQGRINGVALDCAGVPAYVGRRLGLAFTDRTRYGRQPLPAEMRAALDENLQRVRKVDMQVGDVVWIRFERVPQHLAIVGDYPHGGFSLIHAYNGEGVGSVVEHRLDEQWLARIAGVWRYPGIEP
jgi:cell wall-associated NlpC family hydrolase